MNRPYELKDVRCFVLIATAGSISRAATQFNMPKATLSHHLRRLEDALEVELFIRRSRGLELTEAGREFLDNSQAIFDSLDIAASAAQRAHADVAGKLRLVASSAFGTSLIGAAASRVSGTNHQIDFEVMLYPNDKLVGGQFEFDCMVVVGDPALESFGRTKLGNMTFRLYASPLFVERHGAPETPDEVASFDGVVLTQSGVPDLWNLRFDDRSARPEPRAKFVVNEYWMAKYFAVEGLAIGYIPDFFVRYEVTQGALVPLLPEWQSEEIPVYAVYPQYRRGNARIEQLIDTMTTDFNAIVSEPGYVSARIDYGQPSTARGRVD